MTAMTPVFYGQLSSFSIYDLREFSTLSNVSWKNRAPKVGDKVEVFYNIHETKAGVFHNAKWYPAVVTAVHHFDNYDLIFADGPYEHIAYDNVPLSIMRPLSTI